MEEKFRQCPFCKRVILAEANACKHCGKGITPTKTTKNKQSPATSRNQNLLIPKICFWLIIITLFFSFCADIIFRLSHLNPKVAHIESKPINVMESPTQKMITPALLFSTKVGSKSRTFLLQAEYSLSGIVVAQNTNFWVRGFMRNEFDDIALFDLGIVWGNIARKPILKKYFKFKSSKTLGEARMLRYKWKQNKYTNTNVPAHISHSHIIPANDNIIAALFKVKKWQKVKLDGYLVDILYQDGSTHKTSLSRTDTNTTSRGNGACEIFYITGIQIGNKYYK